MWAVVVAGCVWVSMLVCGGVCKDVKLWDVKFIKPRYTTMLIGRLCLN